MLRNPAEASRRSRLATLVAAIALSALPALSADPAPALHATFHGDRELEVRGEGFGAARVVIEVDLDEPHASVSGYSERTRIALPKDGRFELTIIVRPEDSFDCGPDPSGWVVTAATMEGRTLATVRLGCPQRRR